MSPIIFMLTILLLIASSIADDSNGFHMEGSARFDSNGFLVLTNTSRHVYGQAFSDGPLRLKDSPNGTVFSFSVHFFFAIKPKHKKLGSHGMAFVISPTRGIHEAFPDQYLGIFNDTNNGNSSNHIVAIELDITQNDEFGDINDNHVGIDINGLHSVKSAPAGYFGEDGSFKNLSLISGNMMGLSIVYSQEDKQLNVTLYPAQESKPERPLLSLNQDLSPYLFEFMYLGFSASTGSVGAIHYMWSWFVLYGTADPLLEISRLPAFPSYPRKEGLQKLQNVLALFLSLSGFVVLVALILGYLLYLKHKKYMEVLEEWEVQYGPHRFGYKDLFIATKGFKDKEVLGKGGFGKVYKGKLPHSDAKIAVKRISHDSRQGMAEFVAEIATIGRLRHPNLVRLLGYCRHKDELYLVYDFMPNGSLDKFLYHKPNERLDWNQRFKIVKDVASALFYLHHQWLQVVIHRDIKPANVLIDNDMNARLGDFGLAKLYDHGLDPQSSHVAGTFGYISPELSKTGKATTSSDVFAFGIFLLEVTCGRRPINHRASLEEMVLVDWILDLWEKGEILEAVDKRLEGEYKAEQVELVLKLGMLCTHPTAAARPSVHSVMRFLDGVSLLPDNLIDIVKARETSGGTSSSGERVDVPASKTSYATVTITESFASHGR